MTTRVSRYQKGKTNLDFTGDSEWQWHQLGRMQVCTLFQTDNHASTPPLSFLQAGCRSCRPANSIKALKAIYYMNIQNGLSSQLYNQLKSINELLRSQLPGCICIPTTGISRQYLQTKPGQQTNRIRNAKMYHVNTTVFCPNHCSRNPLIASLFNPGFKFASFRHSMHNTENYMLRVNQFQFLLRLRGPIY